MQNTWSLHHTHDVQRLAETDQDRLLQACRDILGRPDTPGRRWLIRQVHGDSAPHGVESVGAAISSLPVLGLGRIRERLRAEFPSVLRGRDVLGRELADQGPARKGAEACILPDLIGPKTGKTVPGARHIGVEGLGEQNPTNAVDERLQRPPVDDRANMGIPGRGTQEAWA